MDEVAACTAAVPGQAATTMGFHGLDMLLRIRELSLSAHATVNCI
jgi:hypothetical protein